VSFSADGAVAIVFFVRSSLRQFFTAPEPPNLLAQARAIDLSIQFLLFWMPVVTLLGWTMEKPMSMLFGEKNKTVASFSTGKLTLTAKIFSKSSFSSALASLSTMLRQMPRPTGLRVASSFRIIL
jgi:hypothetical protein